jgi:uncharacterized damage-inducible protein DinB
MIEIERIKDQLQRAFIGDAWHGPSLREALAGVTAEIAAAKPCNNSHSIWEIVLHIATWEEAIRRRIAGDFVKVSDEEDWRSVTDTGEPAWRNAQAMAGEVHRCLLDEISSLNDADLARVVVSQAGIEHSLYVSLHGAIHHLLYHTGQIAQLKTLAAQSSDDSAS